MSLPGWAICDVTARKLCAVKNLRAVSLHPHAQFLGHSGLDLQPDPSIERPPPGIPGLNAQRGDT